MDLAKLIEQVEVSPTDEAWFGELVSSVTGKYGFDLPVVASTLLEPPSGERRA